MRVFEVIWRGGIADHALEHTRFHVTAESQQAVAKRFPMHSQDGGWLVVPISAITLDEAVAMVDARIANPGGQSHASA